MPRYGQLGLNEFSSLLPAEEIATSSLPKKRMASSIPFDHISLEERQKNCQKPTCAAADTTG
jgi:hypothetical protein